MDKSQISNTEFMADGIKYVCSKYKNRSAGSIAEKNCQKYFKEVLSSWADQVDEEAFSLHPKAFKGSMVLSGLLNIVSAILIWLSLTANSIILSIIGTAVILFSVLLNITESFFYRRIFDFLFPKATSINIMARRAPKGEIKRRIIFGGHADAAYEMTYILHGQIKTVFPVLAGSSIGAAFVLISSIALLIRYIVAGSVSMDGSWQLIGVISVACIPFFLAAAFFINWNRIVDGANDNLSACYVAMSVLKEMSEKNIICESTEVCCLITGSEEAGLRGALNYAQRHRMELSNVETIFIALDIMHEINQLRVFTLGQNGTQKNSNAVGALLIKAGENCGVEIRNSKLLLGATDAEGFSRYSIQACALCGVSLLPRLYYHTRFDTWDNINKDCLQLSHELCMEATRLYDHVGIKTT